MAAVGADELGGEAVLGGIGVPQPCPPFELDLNHVPLFLGDDGRMGVLDVVLRDLAVVDLGRVGEEILDEGLLEDGRAAVLLVSEYPPDRAFAPPVVVNP